MIADAKASRYRLLHNALIEMRYEAHEGRGDNVFRLADLFHRLPLQLERMERGEEGYEAVMRELQTHAERIGLTQWLAHRTEEDANRRQRSGDVFGWQDASDSDMLGRGEALHTLACG
jgi:hypothetical protein